MPVYLISYDLKRNAPLYSYLQLHEKIRSFGNAIKILESTFLVDTTLGAKFMSDQIVSIYQPENHFIIEVRPGSSGAGVLPNSHWAWIKARLENP